MADEAGLVEYLREAVVAVAAQGPSAKTRGPQSTRDNVKAKLARLKAAHSAGLAKAKGASQAKTALENLSVARDLLEQCGNFGTAWAEGVAQAIDERTEIAIAEIDRAESTFLGRKS